MERRELAIRAATNPLFPAASTRDSVLKSLASALPTPAPKPALRCIPIPVVYTWAVPPPAADVSSPTAAATCPAD
jgi:hypothetical protein